MAEVFAGLDPASHRPNRLHDAERDWPETNCYVDLLIEVMGVAGREPAAALGFTVAQDFEGDQFTFFKFPTADLQRLAGLDIQELAIFDGLERHVVTQIARGRLVMVEVDAFYLPDTAGITYRRGHSKTTIGVNALDPEARRMVYFHNSGVFALDGTDYDGIFAASGAAGGLPLFPYAEFVKLGAAPASRQSIETAVELLACHLERRPRQNPLSAYRAAFARHAEDLAGRPPEYFHTYAFNTLRQVGANFELLSSHLDWLGENGVSGFDEAAEAAGRISAGAKTMQFKLARAMAKKRFDGLADAIAPMAEAHDHLMHALEGGVAQAPASRAA